MVDFEDDDDDDDDDELFCGMVEPRKALCSNSNYYTTPPQVRYLLGGCFSVFIIDFEQV